MWKHYRSQTARPAIKWMNRLALCGISIGTMSWISVSSIMGGMQNERRELILENKPHLFWEGKPQKKSDLPTKSLAPEVANSIKGISYTLQTEALLEIPGNDRFQGKTFGSGVVIKGVENLENKAVLGNELADFLAIAAGDEIRLRNAWRLELEPVDLVCAGVFKTGHYEIDRLVIHMDQNKLERWLGLEKSYNRVEVRVHDPHDLSSLKIALQQHFGLNFKTWNEADAALLYSLKLEKIFMNVAMIFVSLLATLAVHLALSVRIVDKTREIGILMAMGADPEELSMMYLLEGALLGLLGSAAGLLLSYFLCHFLTGYYEFPNFYYSTKIPVDWHWGKSLTMAGITTLVATLASWIPAKRVTHTQIQEALRS